jgi:hypothetical protein
MAFPTSLFEKRGFRIAPVFFWLAAIENGGTSMYRAQADTAFVFFE